jgi:DNA-binding beta-propeller fold protein YncE
VSPDGASVYVAGGLGRGVLQYDVGADGALTAKRPPSVAGTGPGAIAVNPSGASVYVTAVEYDALLQYDVGTDGALSPKTPPTAVADGPLAIAVSPSGTSVYAAGQGGKDLMQYDVGADGALTPKNPPTARSLDYVNHVVVSPDGTSAYATASGAFAEDSVQSPVVEQYDVGADGALTPKNPPSVAATGARAIAVEPGRHQRLRHRQ